MRKSEIEAIKFEDVESQLAEDLVSRNVAATDYNLRVAFSEYKSGLEKERIDEIVLRLKALSEITIAFHASEKKIPNRKLMLKKLINDDDLDMLSQLESENTDIINQENDKEAKKSEREAKKNQAKQYLKSVKKSDITSLTKAKEMLWHLKSLLEQE